MNFTDLVFVLVIAALMALPSLIGHAHDRRIDRQLRAAERRGNRARGVRRAEYQRAA